MRSGVLLGTGFVIGFAIAWVARPSETGIGPVRGTAEERRAAVDARPGSRYAAAEEASRIILGDVTRVPFQELYSVLSVRSPEELAKIAQQLNALPPGIDDARESRRELLSRKAGL